MTSPNARLLLAIIAAHLLVLAALITEVRRPDARGTLFPVLEATEVAAPVAATVVVPDSMPVVADADEPSFEIAVERNEAAAGLSGAGCELTQAVQSALRESPDVRSALDRVPPHARSVANALMLWDGRWIEVAALGGAATLDPIRASIIASVRAADPLCRAASIVGPRLLLIEDASGMTVIAIGSGTWAWADLLS